MLLARFEPMEGTFSDSGYLAVMAASYPRMERKRTLPGIPEREVQWKKQACLG
ncbi:hypothetical protein AvCA_26960 [Azotobacter vinelandii CA]|uniref:Uncharacterized protein n=2 Tax=Azotobacter vinelandii TaxID=354 RepID=C1DJV2_AZOVD|nr:hypothetical protein Avin_26960 [Azotobacter vinelandii DJ]AGK16572.1 hypothetical protein AvCA_26960 [Azotobacter vinelandii CA]AGK20817.1 hypothetical protein AvCA6_26960 [Azotobacter vinelandii CA6]